MRKLLALFLIVVIVFPLTMAALSVIAVSSWVLDRAFYQDLLGDERLYEVLLSEELPNYFSRRVVTEADDIPARTLSLALREVVTPQYLRDEATRLVDQAFDALEGRRDTWDLYLNIAPIKAAVRGESRMRFAQALAANLPKCAAGQQPIAPGGTLQRCLASDVSVAEAAEAIAAALPTFVDKFPDQINLSRERIDLRHDLRGINLLWTGQDALNLAIVVLVLLAGGSWFAAALIAGEDRRARLMWLGWSLFVPALLIFMIGLAVNTDMTTGWVRFGLNEARFDEFETSAEFRLALLDVVRGALNTVANGFLMAGGVAGAMAIALVAWGGATPAERRPVYAPVAPVAPTTPATPTSATDAQPASPSPTHEQPPAAPSS
jgi:hypothetical protein